MLLLLLIIYLSSLYYYVNSIQILTNTTKLYNRNSIEIKIILNDNEMYSNTMWLGLFYPYESDVTALDNIPTDQYTAPPYVKTYPYKWFNVDNNTNTYTFVVDNLFTDDCKFSIIDGGMDTNTKAIVLAESERIEFLDPKEILLKGHLSRTSNENEMGMIFSTRYNNDDRSLEIRWGYSKNYMIYSTTNIYSSTYKETDMCGPPANTTYGFFNPYYWHYGIISNLSSNQLVYYYYKNVTTNTSSDIYSFRSLPRKDDATKFIILGDIGVTDRDNATTHMVYNNNNNYYYYNHHHHYYYNYYYYYEYNYY